MHQRKVKAHRLFIDGKSMFEKGDLIGAEKLLLRSLRLHATPNVEKLLRQIQSKAKAAKSPAPDATDTEHKTHSYHKIDHAAPSCSGTQGRRRRSSFKRSSEQEYTKEQVEAVRSVFKSQNYYTILNVEPDASTAEINSSYKKLALLVHPDKNKAPGANKAFQIINSAKDVLTDHIHRRKYDKQLEESYNINISTIPNADNLEIPPWLMVGGIVILAAGLFGSWLSSRQQRRSRKD